MSVQLCFGLSATNKQPITIPVSEVESRVAHIVKHGTYVDSAMQTKVHDTYEVLAGHGMLRAFMDLDIKRWLDGSAISRKDGVLLAECVRSALEELQPMWDSDYGRVVIGNSSGNKSKTEYCVSFRVWFPCIVGSRESIALFVGDLYSFALPVFQLCVEKYCERIDWLAFMDRSVYKNMGKLRLPGCTKQGELHRPLLIDPELSSVGWSYTDTLVTYWLEDEIKQLPAVKTSDVNITNEQPISESRTLDTTNIDLQATLSDRCFQLITELANTIVKEWDTNYTRFQIIAGLWCLEPSERMRTFIHEQAAAKNPENSRDSVEGQIARIRFSGISIKTILKLAWDTDKELVLGVKRQFVSEWKELFGDETSESDLSHIDEILHQGDLQQFWTYQEYSEQYVKPYPFQEWDTILVQSQMGTGKTVQLFDVIRSFKRVLLLSARRSYSAFIHSELLTVDLGFTNYMNAKGHLSGHNKLILQVESLHRIAWEYQPYDLVIMDESESVLFQMNSVGTHGEHHKENYEMLERVVREAKKVVAMDAFVNIRSFTFFDHMRERSKAIFIRNTFQPYDRQAMELCAVQGNRILPDFAGLIQQCRDFAAAGKRIVFVCASKLRGKKLFELLRDDGYTVLFHSSEDSAEEKNLLLNVRSEWAKYQIVIYTTTITVGVSYSNVPIQSEFDELFLYATASCALPRDIAQALLRARVIKSNRLWFCIEERCIKPAKVGFKTIQQDLQGRKELFAASSQWLTTPEWVSQLIAQNENEIAVSRKYFPLVLKRYLRMSGYTLQMPTAAEELLTVDIDAEVKPAFEDIQEIDDVEADEIEEKLMIGEATRENKLALLKYRFLSRFQEGDEARVVAKQTWDTLFVAEEGKKRSREGLFWNIVHEKQRDLRRAMAAEAESHYVEHAKIGLLRQKCIGEICGVLGIANSCCEKSWTQEEFTTLAPKLLKDEERIRKVMGLRPYRGKKKESEFLRGCDLIEQAFISWSGNSLEKVAKLKKQNGKVTRLYTISVVQIVPKIWNALK
jgi:hypothetical protein